MTIMYVYFLGLWLIGPFDSLEACQKARDWQMKWGTREQVEQCWTVLDARKVYEVMPPTYGAPLTPDEAERRAK